MSCSRLDITKASSDWVVQEKSVIGFSTSKFQVPLRPDISGVAVMTSLAVNKCKFSVAHGPFLTLAAELLSPFNRLPLQLPHMVHSAARGWGHLHANGLQCHREYNIEFLMKRRAIYFDAHYGGNFSIIPYLTLNYTVRKGG